MRAFRPAFLLTALCAGGLAHAGEPPLRTGVVPESPPFVETRDGQLAGFTVDLFRAIGTRLKRPVDFVQAPMPQLTADLAAGKLDVLAGPIQATPDRAADLLFTEGYIWSEYQFGARRGVTITKPADLHGKRLAVQTGTEYAEWAELNAAKYGFAVEQRATLGQVLDAVRSGAADACLSDSPGLQAASHGQDSLEPSLALPETRVHDSAAVAHTDVELRDEIEDALICLKQDGTVARLSRTWFGEEPDQEDLQKLIVPGRGVPGLTGYDPKPRKAHCGP